MSPPEVAEATGPRGLLHAMAECAVLPAAERWLWSSGVAPGILSPSAAEPIPFDTGSPPFALDLEVRAAIAESLASTVHLGYPPPEGDPALRAEIAAFNRRVVGLPHDADQILVTYGAMQALADVVAAVAVGREVLLPAPFWFQFPHLVRQKGAVPKAVPTDPARGFKLTPEGLEAAIGPRTRLLVLTNPNNPTGAVYTADELAALAAVVERHPDLLVVSDEVYDLLLLDEPPGTSDELRAAPSLGSLPAIADRVFVVNSLSKNQAMSGLRVGYVATSSPGWIERVIDRQRFCSLGVNTFLQAGARAGIAAAPRIVGGILRQLRPRRSWAAELLCAIPGLRFMPPQAGYYFWIDVSAYLGRHTRAGAPVADDHDLARHLETSAGVKVVDGTSCGLPGWLRITYALPEEVFEEGARRMARAFAELAR